MKHVYKAAAVGGVGLMVVAFWTTPAKPASTVTVQHDKQTGRVEVSEDGAAVLRYNFTTVPVPERVKGRKYAEARSDYIHPLYGLGGEILTEDFPDDHPHHRGVYWAWPEVYYKGEKRDLHALQGVFARPSKLIRAEADGEAGLIEAESIWKWGDVEPIVRERAIIRVHPGGDDGRFIDLEFRFTALVKGVSVARRGQKAYGGLNLRTTLHGGQKITHRTDPAGARMARRSWGQIVGVPKGGKKAVAIGILQHADNPEYPGDWVEYPKIAWLQPTFPAKGKKHPLPTDKPLVLRFRLWVRSKAATDEQLADAWKAYNTKKEP